MDFESSKDMKVPAAEDKTVLITADPGGEYSQVCSTTLIYIDPEREAAARKKFDSYVVPVSLIFLVLSTLDRNNLGNARVFGFDEDIGLKGGEFGNINTLSSVCTIVFEVPWTLAVRRFGAKKAIGTAFILWSACTLGTAFIHTYGQAIACRMLLNAAEAGLS